MFHTVRNTALEIVRPGTGNTLPDGEIGEVVVTTFNPAYPNTLVRFGTGELWEIMPGVCSTGRTHRRIRRWLGRADQTDKVRGMFGHSGQVMAIARRFGMATARLVVAPQSGYDTMTLRLECNTVDEAPVNRIAETMRDVTKLRGEVELLPEGSPERR